jgi:hypothetical protein
MAEVTTRSTVYSYPHGQKEAYYAKKGLKYQLEAIRKLREPIKAGDHRVALHGVKIAVASDFQPKVLAAARKVFSPITGLSVDPRWPVADRWPMTQFGFPTTQVPAYYMGALFETLPRSFALRFFADQFFGRLCGSTFISRAGATLLRFSSAENSALFVKGLQQTDSKETVRLLRYMQSQRDIRDYRFQRYSVSELIAAL